MSFIKSKWYRTDRNKKLAGVCAGVAEVYGVHPDTVRLIYAFLVPGMITVYLIQWMIYPKR
ncbi:PspC domain-containing protein [Corynebacterium sp. 320]|uniref:PspC domain-containing protein n=2 Tax=Corynebacterium TaxID=1716 RepID=A0ABQ6VFJ0_9CORY|nr:MULTISPECIES: PspC domain-containing protein [Corynebacterium]KAB1502909.1 PspC domain-containing protein [Corynebacterium sp. 320]KAB1550494.1 PspC domain-containing protein [Corynebacterium sp. 319]KAB1554853.1 PspC domain-containing protein [Corynebacterium sp. 321]KAB3519215.1 PspC domain-containing protein [Corynebacterium zhongnanshanii]KAB3526572.1 PspC domain-containing protein [Corynebacterium sp. 250]